MSGTLKCGSGTVRVGNECVPLHARCGMGTYLSPKDQQCLPTAKTTPVSAQADMKPRPSSNSASVVQAAKESLAFSSTDIVPSTETFKHPQCRLTKDPSTSPISKTWAEKQEILRNYINGNTTTLYGGPKYQCTADDSNAVFKDASGNNLGDCDPSDATTNIDNGKCGRRNQYFGCTNENGHVYVKNADSGSPPPPSERFLTYAQLLEMKDASEATCRLNTHGIMPTNSKTEIGTAAMWSNDSTCGGFCKRSLSP